MSREPKKPKTVNRGKRLLCCICRKRSPRKVTTPAPWTCPKCQAQLNEASDAKG